MARRLFLLVLLKLYRSSFLLSSFVYHLLCQPLNTTVPPSNSSSPKFRNPLSVVYPFLILFLALPHPHRAATSVELFRTAGPSCYLAGEFQAFPLACVLEMFRVFLLR